MNLLVGICDYHLLRIQTFIQPIPCHTEVGIKGVGKSHMSFIQSGGIDGTALTDVNKFLIICLASFIVGDKATDVVIPTVGMDVTECLVHVPLSVDDEEAVVEAESVEAAEE